jgi:hypothetical protein
MALQGYGAWFDATFGDGQEGLFEEVLGQIRDAADGPQVDVRQDLIAQLQGPIFSVTSPSGADGVDAGTVEWLLAAKTRNESAVAEAMRKMLEPDPEVRQVVIKEHVAWVFRDMRKEATRRGTDRVAAASWRGTADDANLSGLELSNYSFCVADGYLFVASDVDMIRKALDRGDLPAISDVASYADVRAEITREPSTLIAWQYSQPRGGWGATYEALRNGGATSGARVVGLLSRLLSVIRAPSADKTAPTHRPIDFALLPKFQAVEHHLQAGGARVSRVDEGWLLHGFVLKQQVQ